MEGVEGVEQLRRRPAVLRPSATICAQIADALGAAALVGRQHEVVDLVILVAGQVRRRAAGGDLRRALLAHLGTDLSASSSDGTMRPSSWPAARSPGLPDGRRIGRRAQSTVGAAAICGRPQARRHEPIALAPVCWPTISTRRCLLIARSGPGRQSGTSLPVLDRASLNQVQICGHEVADVHPPAPPWPGSPAAAFQPWVSIRQTPIDSTSRASRTAASWAWPRRAGLTVARPTCNHAQSGRTAGPSRRCSTVAAGMQPPDDQSSPSPPRRRSPGSTSRP